MLDIDAAAVRNRFPPAAEDRRYVSETLVASLLKTMDFCLPISAMALSSSF
jgi:hypothetical protein